MPDDPKKIIVDDDWKAQARREKERLAQEAQAAPGGAPVPQGMFTELVNILVMQAMVGFGMFQGPGGERIPPNLATAKHFIDLLQALDEKTTGNLTPDEKRMLDQVLYEMRMTYVQMSAAAMPPGAGGPVTPTPAGSSIET
jgi:hypothetical protein